MAGRSINDALCMAMRYRELGIACSFICLMEALNHVEEFDGIIQTNQELLEGACNRGVDAHIVLDTANFRLAVHDKIAQNSICSILYDVAHRDLVLVLDGVQSEPNGIDFVKALSHMPGCADHVGVILYADLYRTSADLQSLADHAVHVYLTRFPYHRKCTAVFPTGPAVTANFIQLLMRILRSNAPSIAVDGRDRKIVEKAMRFVLDNGLSPNLIEFHMVHGLDAELQRKLAHDGWKVRVKLPFGTESYPYVTSLFVSRLLYWP